MKLRNKRTGKIIDERYFGCLLRTQTGEVLGRAFGSIAELNKEWEDYAPTEPLIKDEKIRKAVRAWAKINGATGLKYFEGENCLEDIFRNEIHFNQPLCLEDGKTYTTDELCGEGDE